MIYDSRALDMKAKVATLHAPFMLIWATMDFVVFLTEAWRSRVSPSSLDGAKGPRLETSLKLKCPYC